MRFSEITIHTTTAGSEVISGLLMASGISCFSVDDPADLAKLIETRAIPFDYIEDGLLREGGDVLVRVYPAENEQGELQKESVLAGLEKLRSEGNDWMGSLQTEIVMTDEKDWENNWRKYFHPLEIGKRFVVMPSWEKCDAKGRLVIEIDPASSFGTGQHETTALCLAALETLSPEGKRVLDMGCGSGILGIGAAKCNAARVDCVDIDLTAADTTRENAAKNGISPEVLQSECGNVLTDAALWEKYAGREYDIILANIVADIINEMLPLFKACLTADGILVCSGIIAPRKEFVLDALDKNGFAAVEINEKNDWVAMVCRKK